MQPVEHLGQRAQLQPVQLDVLAGRQLGVVAAELDRQLAEGAVLRRGHDAAGGLDAQHEVADLGLVLVQAVPLEAHHVLFGDVEIVALSQLFQLIDDLERELLTLQALDVVPLEDEVPVWCGTGSGGRGHRGGPCGRV